MLSILVPTIGRADTILRAVESALRVDSALVSEVVILDNSQDIGFKQFLTEFLSKTDDERLRVISYPERKSMSESWNSGLDYINNKWVLYLHDDDQLLDVNDSVDSIVKDLLLTPDIGFLSYNYVLSIPFNVIKKTRLAKVNRRITDRGNGKVLSIIKDCPKFVSTIINAEKLRAIGGWKAEDGYFLDLAAFVLLNSKFSCEFKTLFLGVYYIHADNFSSIERRNEGYGDYFPEACRKVFSLYNDAFVRKEFLRVVTNFVYPKKHNFLRVLMSDLKAILFKC